MDEKEAEARPVMGTIFLVLLQLTSTTLTCLQCYIVHFVPSYWLLAFFSVQLFLDCMFSSWNAGPHEAKAIALIQAIKDVEVWKELMKFRSFYYHNTYCHFPFADPRRGLCGVATSCTSRLE